MVSQMHILANKCTSLTKSHFLVVIMLTVKNLFFLGVSVLSFYIYGYFDCCISQLWTMAKMFLACYFKVGTCPTCAYLSALEPWQTLLSTFSKPYSVLLGPPQSQRRLRKCRRRVLFAMRSEVIIQAQGFPGKHRHADVLVQLPAHTVRNDSC